MKTIMAYCMFMILCISSLAIAADHESYNYIVFSSPGDTLKTSNSSAIGGNYIAHRGSGTVSWYWNPYGCFDKNGVRMNSTTVGNTLKYAFDNWEDVTTSTIAFSKQDSTHIDVYDADGNNIIFWAVADSMYNMCGFNAGTRALTATTTNSSDRTLIVESDIIFNGQDYRWAYDITDVDQYAYPKPVAGIEAIATHEIGHLLGFHHNSIAASVMNNSIGYQFDNDWHTLGEEDEFAVSFVYGGNIIDNVTLTHPTDNGDDPFLNWDITIASGKTLTLELNGIANKLQIEPTKAIYVNGTFRTSNHAYITSQNSNKWGGFVINSGGNLDIGCNTTIEKATTGIHTYGSSPISVASGKKLTIKDCSSAGLHIHNSSPTISRVQVEGVTTGYGGIMVEGSSSNPTLQYNTMTSSLYGVNQGNYADANMYWNYLHSNTSHCINLGTAAGLNLENASGYGNNAIEPESGDRAINNNSTNGTIYADKNHWHWNGGAHGSIFGDSTYVNDYMDTLSVHPSGAGAGKLASLVRLTDFQQAMQSEEMGSYDLAYDLFADILTSSDNPQDKRRALKFMLRIKDKTGQDYSDLKSVVAQEQMAYKENDNYRAVLDYIACELKNREGNKSEAIEAFHDMASDYLDTPMEVEMLCRIAELYGDLGNSDQALEYANRAAAINPGQSILMTAYAAAGQKYNPLEFSDRYKNWDGVYKDSDDPETELNETTTPSITITPNPANPATTLHYTIVQPGNVKLAVYNAGGQKVATLVDSYMHAGKHSAVFDGSNLASGVYFYRLESTGFAKSGKMLLVK